MTTLSDDAVLLDHASKARPGIGGDLVRRFRDGELGLAPIAAALVLIWLVFGLLDGAFLSSTNLVNLALQAVAGGIIALGVVLTLMIGQIDLSVGAVSGLGAATVSVAVMRGGLPLWLAVLLAVLAGVAIGVTYGVLFTLLALPSFVLTLAGMLMVVGLQLWVLGSTGTVNLPFESWLVRFCQQMFLPSVVTVALIALVVGACAASWLRNRARRLAVDLPAPSLRTVVLRLVVLALVLLVVAWYLGTDRGVPAMFAFFLVLVAGTDLVLRRTRWGRAVRAIGGNVDSARRAGLPVRAVTISVFAACSALAALGGVVSAGRLASAYQGTGGTSASLTAIAAAVIGGVSLYGGRGSAWSALLGILVLQSISNGLTLLNLGESVAYAVTGAVLLVALTIDALSRRAREGRRGGR